MNIARTLLAASVAASFSLSLGTGVALAQAPTPTCGDAFAARIAAQGDFDAAVADDNAFADAVAEREEIAGALNVERARTGDLTEARDEARSQLALANTGHTEATPEELRPRPATQEEIDRLREAAETGEVTNLEGRIAAIQLVLTRTQELAEAELALENNLSRIETLESELVAAQERETDLRIVAEETDVEALRFSLDAAIATANEACEGQTTSTPPPPPVVVELDDDDNAPLPSGGVDTGDGSSL